MKTFVLFMFFFGASRLAFSKAVVSLFSSKSSLATRLWKLRADHEEPRTVLSPLACSRSRHDSAEGLFLEFCAAMLHDPTLPYPA